MKRTVLLLALILCLLSLCRSQVGRIPVYSFSLSTALSLDSSTAAAVFDLDVQAVFQSGQSPTSSDAVYVLVSTSNSSTCSIELAGGSSGDYSTGGPVSCSVTPQWEFSNSFTPYAPVIFSTSHSLAITLSPDSADSFHVLLYAVNDTYQLDVLPDYPLLTGQSSTGATSLSSPNVTALSSTPSPSNPLTVRFGLTFMSTGTESGYPFYFTENNFTVLFSLQLQFVQGSSFNSTDALYMAVAGSCDLLPTSDNPDLYYNYYDQPALLQDAQLVTANDNFVRPFASDESGPLLDHFGVGFLSAFEHYFVVSFDPLLQQYCFTDEDGAVLGFTNSSATPLITLLPSYLRPVTLYTFTYSHDLYSADSYDFVDPILSIRATLVCIWEMGTSPTSVDALYSIISTLPGSTVRYSLTDFDAELLGNHSSNGSFVPATVNHFTKYSVNSFNPYGALVFNDDREQSMVLKPSTEPDIDFSCYVEHSFYKCDMYPLIYDPQSYVGAVERPNVTLVNERQQTSHAITAVITLPLTPRDSLPLYEGSNMTLTLTLQLAFVSGTSFTSADAIYLAITGTGSLKGVTNTSINDAMTLVVGGSLYYRDNLVYPFRADLSLPLGLSFVLDSAHFYSTVNNLFDSGRYCISYYKLNHYQGAACTVEGVEPAITVVSSPAAAIGDPQFVGLLGQSFQIHGMDGGVYSIISSAELQVNARFRYLSSGRCPVYEDGSEARNCWSHRGSYFESLGFLTSSGDRLVIEAADWKHGIGRVTLNNQSLAIARHGNPLSYTGLDLQLTMADAHHLTLTAASSQWSFHIDSSDRFLNMAQVVVNDWQRLVSQVRPHGLLGQTYRSTPRLAASGEKNEVEHVEGRVDDYIEANNDLLGCDTLHNLFAC